MMPTNPARWPLPGQPEWDNTDYARDYVWLGQPREGVEVPQRLTVREWFRKDRAAMWQRETHPAHACAKLIDDVAAQIVWTNNIPDGYHEVDGVEIRRAGVSDYCLLWLPAEMVRLYGMREAAARLEALLELAWPVADRVKYDPIYAMIRRASAAVNWRGTLCD